MSTEPENPQMDVYSGVRWSAASAWGRQAVQFGVSIVLARLLLPQDYGLLAMAAVFVGFLGVFMTMGFGTAVIQRREVSDALLSSLYYVVLAVAAVLTVATLVAAPLCAWIYHDPRVMPVMAVLGASFLLSAPGVIPSALLNRQMRFGRLAVVELISVVIGGVASLTLAFAGFGVWALVIWLLASTAVSSVLYQAVCGWRPRLTFNWAEVRSVWNFGANVTGFSMFSYFASNADKFIIGVFFGAGPLGYYSLAYNILLKPSEAVTTVLLRVLFPILSRTQDDDARFKALYLRACGAIAFVTFPMMLGLTAVAHPFVQVVLGEKWLPAVPLIVILAPVGALQAVWGPVRLLFLAKNRTDWYFRIGVAQSCVMVCAFFAGIPWGTLGVAVAYVVVNLFWLPVWLWLGSKLVTGMRMREFGIELLPYGLLSLVMFFVVLMFEKTLNSIGVAEPVVLVISVAVGVCVYVGASLMTQPTALTDLARMLPTRWTRSLFPRNNESTGFDDVPACSPEFDPLA